MARALRSAAGRAHGCECWYSDGIVVSVAWERWVISSRLECSPPERSHEHGHYTFAC